MDQIKIGKFIAQKRAEQKMTQMQLAEKLGITDRAVSKWETGKSLPDASITLELCDLLGITVNDLFNGEVVSMENKNAQNEQLLIELVKQKEDADKRLLLFEIVILVITSLCLLSMSAVSVILYKMNKPTWQYAIIIAVGIIQFVISCMFAIRIEQVAGYYKCSKCGHTYKPSYSSLTLSMHFGRTHYLKCPHCGKRSWQKKVVSKE